MIEKYNIRTDLALEEKERFESDNVEVSGVLLEEKELEELEIKITTVKIETEKGAKVMKKPVGTYITIEAPNLSAPDEAYHGEVSAIIANEIKRLLPKKDELAVLIVGLGNREVTPDALGPFVVNNVCVTRHIVKEYGKYAMGKNHIYLVSALIPGVMGQTGMETVEIIKGVVEETKPDCAIVVDALAARNSKRLNRTIQIADTGVHPGSGVGNHRRGINEETIGIPVIGIGVPTVVDAATIVNDTMENFIYAMEQSKALEGTAKVLGRYTEVEKYELIKELIAPHLNGMFVTPKDIDETMKRMSYTISESLNAVFQNGQKRGER